MKKKEYIKPEMKVFKMETQAILAGSYIERAKEEDYSDENIDKITEWGGNIFAD